VAQHRITETRQLAIGLRTRLRNQRKGFLKIVISRTRDLRVAFVRTRVPPELPFGNLSRLARPKKKARRCGSSGLKVGGRMWAVVRVRMSGRMR
jgi:hypothetical protein